MKKISVKKYAQALYESVKDLDKKQAEVEVANFIKVLIKSKSLKLADRIIGEFDKYSNLQNGILEVTVISAKKLSAGAEKELADQIKKEKKASKVEIINLEDPSLIGGLVIKIGDEILDGSLKTRLELLKQKFN